MAHEAMAGVLLKELIERCMESWDLAVGNPQLEAERIRQPDQPGSRPERVGQRFAVCPASRHSVSNRQSARGEPDPRPTKGASSVNPTPPRKVDNGAKRLEQIFTLLNPRRREGLDAFVAKSHESLNQLAETAMSATAEVLEATGCTSREQRAPERPSLHFNRSETEPDQGSAIAVSLFLTSACRRDP